MEKYDLENVKYVLFEIFVWPSSIIGAAIGVYTGYDEVGVGAALFFAFMGGIGGRFAGLVMTRLILVLILYWPVTITVMVLFSFGLISYNLWDIKF